MRKCEQCKVNNAQTQITHEFKTMNVCNECKHLLQGAGPSKPAPISKAGYKERIEKAVADYCGKG